MAIRLLGIWIILILCASSWGWASVLEEAADLTFILRANPIQSPIKNRKPFHSIPENRHQSAYFRRGLFGFIRNIFRRKINLPATSPRVVPDSGWGQYKSTASFAVYY